MSLENDLEILEKKYKLLDKKYKDKLSGANRAIKIAAGITVILLVLIAIDLFFSTSLMDLMPEIIIFLLPLIIMGIGIYYIESLHSISIKRVRVRVEAENRIEYEMEKKIEGEKKWE